MARSRLDKTFDYGEGKTITVSIQQLAGFRAGKLWWRLQGVLGPVLAKLGAGVSEADLGKGIFDTDLDLATLLPAVGRALEALAANMDPEAYERLMREVLDGALLIDEEAQSKRPLLQAFDDVMAGRPLLQIKILLFALEVNFADFWPALAAKVQEAQEQARASKSKALNTSVPAGPVTG